MFKWAVNKLFGTQNERELRRLWPMVEKVNSLEPYYKALTNDDLVAKTAEFKLRIEQGESLDSVLFDAFAVVREISSRVLGMRHFDVQILGGIVLHQGKIAEMKTGEGKTLCATLPVYLNALTGKGVHVVTVNDYLAKRDTEWMGRIYRSLGLSVGVVLESISRQTRHEAYRSDITYGQNNQFGFDYLRDNMKMDTAEMVQRGHNFAIVDEVDSILIDESRTPLIISGASENPRETYGVADRMVRRLIDENVGLEQRLLKTTEAISIDALEPEVVSEELFFTIDLKSRHVALTEKGVRRVEELLTIDNLFDPLHVEALHHVNQALKAHLTFKADVDYLVKDGQVVIVDEFTGRQMEGRRWSDGLHQAVEAKEGVTIARESETLGVITFQNYFRMYSKLAGMTGTADTESVEFKKIYNLDVVVMPTNRPMIRKDFPDVIFSTKHGKMKAVCDEIEDCHKRGQPVLVGTVSIESSEQFAKLLTRRGVRHHVLNAKHHEREAEIVAQAGRFGAVTISTNMAGRGTDIVLGGNPEFLARSDVGAQKDRDEEDYKAEYEDALIHYTDVCAQEKQKVLEAGGLHILGTERHESRRIDNQLRGRSGRQGDPGSSRFYVSLEDDLMKRFGGERMQVFMKRFGMSDEDAIDGPGVSWAIENAQTKVEGFHFDIRKHLLEYDDVLSKQREVVYSLRKTILNDLDVEPLVLQMVPDVVEDIVISRANEKEAIANWDVKGMFAECNRQFGLALSGDKFSAQIVSNEANKGIAQSIFDFMNEQVLLAYEERKTKLGSDTMRKFARFLYLQGIDFFWKEHLTNMDHLREGIYLRSYAQKNPLHEYQREAFELFSNLMITIKSEVLLRLFTSELLTEEEIEEREQKERERQRKREEQAKTIHEEIGAQKSENEKTTDDVVGVNRKHRRMLQAQQKSKRKK